MAAAPSSYGRLVKAALTTLVLTLLAISFASIGSTSGYSLFERDGERRAGPNVSVAYGKILDPLERIRIVLHSAPRGTERHDVPVIGTLLPHEMVPTQKDPAKSLALAIQAALFAAFGLMVLWWGRDRASLWLGVTCATLAPELITLYGFVPETWMLLCRIAADLLTFVAFYALFAMADSVALESLPVNDRMRGALGAARAGVILVIAAVAVPDLAEMLLPVAFGTAAPAALVRAGDLATTVCWSVVFCLLPLIVLGLSSLRATSGERRKRSQIIFITTLAGLSGVAFSVATELARGAAPHFEQWWFTLLLVPIGFIVVIRAFGVIDVQVIVSRILLVSAMTILIGLAIFVTEGFVHAILDEWLKPKDESQKRQFDAVLQFVVGFVLVLVFGSLHHRIDRGLEKIVFRRRDRAISKLREFGEHRAAEFVEVTTLWESTAALVSETLGSAAVAIYESGDDAYQLVLSVGSAPWPTCLVEDDPRFDPKHAAESDAYLFRLEVGGTDLGALGVHPRSSTMEPVYDKEEVEALEELAHATAEATLTIRVRQFTSFAQDVADGRVTEADARKRATALRDVFSAFAVSKPEPET
ncbi:MAG: hypothetical protein GIW95_07280 [Candidatus Eremiobacteraeota bacterium]|nr:hypothetical protein [Candidatus Eremiobacteraeota bacterium]